MKLKYCPKCKLSKLISEFGLNKTKYDGLQGNCKTCRNSYLKEWYQDNKILHKARVRVNDDIRHKKIKNTLSEYLLEHPCVDCGEKDIVVLQFDHMRDKEKEIGLMVSRKFAWNKILKDEKLINFKFTRQKPIDHFIMDFYCASLHLAIEIDGEIHNFQKTRDMERDNLLEQKFGLRIIRYTNKEVLNNIEKITKDLIQKIKYINTTPP